MPACNLTWYQPKVRRIMKDIKALKRSEIAEILSISHQAVSKNIKNGKYESDITWLIQILDKAGYEIKEKNEEE